MIDNLLNLKVTKTGQPPTEVHKVEVTAVAGGIASTETFTFNVIGEQVNTTETFAPNEVKTISATHNQNTRGIVSVTASPSNITRNCFLDCSAASDQC